MRKILLSEFPCAGNRKVDPRNFGFTEAKLQDLQIVIDVMADYSFRPSQVGKVLKNCFERSGAALEVAVRGVLSRKSS